MGTPSAYKNNKIVEKSQEREMYTGGRGETRVPKEGGGKEANVDECALDSSAYLVQPNWGGSEPSLIYIFRNRVRVEL